MARYPSTGYPCILHECVLLPNAEYEWLATGKIVTATFRGCGCCDFSDTLPVLPGLLKGTGLDLSVLVELHLLDLIV